MTDAPNLTPTVPAGAPAGATLTPAPGGAEPRNLLLNALAES